MDRYRQSTNRDNWRVPNIEQKTRAASK
jgi:hypothetical protein